MKERWGAKACLSLHKPCAKPVVGIIYNNTARRGIVVNRESSFQPVVRSLSPLHTHTRDRELPQDVRKHALQDGISCISQLWSG